METKVKVLIAVLVVVTLSHITLLAGEEKDGFTQFLNDVSVAWVAQNYTGMVQVINDRLVTHTNDLAALMMKMNYHLAFDYNLELAQSLVEIFTNTLASLDWTSDPMAELIALGSVHVSVLNPQEAQEIGIVYGLSTNQIAELHAESPEEYPLAEFMMRLGQVQWAE